MYAPRVFVSMIGALVVFAVATYFLTQSLSTTLIETAVCAVLIQIGYFGGVLFLVWKEARLKEPRLRGKGIVVAQNADRHEELKSPALNTSETLHP